MTSTTTTLDATQRDAVPATASQAVLVHSAPVPSDAVSVRGPDFDRPIGLQELLGSYERIGFQATSFGRAISIVEKMVSQSAKEELLEIKSERSQTDQAQAHP